MNNYIYQDNLCLIKTNKYKTISIYLNFIKEYDPKTKLILNLLARFIGEYSALYPDKERMTKARDMLYGASLGAYTKVKTNLIFLTLKFSFINPRFLTDVKLNDFLDFFHECVKNVYFSENLLNEIKKNYQDSILRYLDKPSSYAGNRVCQILSQENKLMAIYDLDQLSLLDSISLADVKEGYNKLFTDFTIKNYIVGDYDDRLVEELKVYQNNQHCTLANQALMIKDIGEVIEEKAVSQSCLIDIYATPSNRLHSDYYAYFLGNALLGIVPTSFLFNEVREKLSLCYYISVQEYKNEGLVKIITLFDYHNKEIVLKKIREQMKRLIDGDYQAEELETAKIMLQDNLNSLLDSNDSLMEYLMINDLNGLQISLEDYANKINKVTMEDISRVFKNYHHVLTYLLKGVKDEKNL